MAPDWAVNREFTPVHSLVNFFGKLWSNFFLMPCSVGNTSHVAASPLRVAKLLPVHRREDPVTKVAESPLEVEMAREDSRNLRPPLWNGLP